jgi:hypothetical protein
MNFINLGWILFILWSTIYFWARLTSAYGILIGLAGLPLGLLIGVSIPVALDYLYPFPLCVQAFVQEGK